ncbi:uncharacterized protein BJX67DRAFT_347391 [Aspergillus lucknowensis]|uniref:Uncharacterized protein n=1 Tax=Aspergillus lucknowensis TaxID=176173 RepID=A0ABR4LY26_9EURO
MLDGGSWMEKPSKGIKSLTFAYWIPRHRWRNPWYRKTFARALESAAEDSGECLSMSSLDLENDTNLLLPAICDVMGRANNCEPSQVAIRGAPEGHHHKTSSTPQQPDLVSSTLSSPLPPHTTSSRDVAVVKCKPVKIDPLVPCTKFQKRQPDGGRPSGNSPSKSSLLRIPLDPTNGLPSNPLTTEVQCRGVRREHRIPHQLQGGGGVGGLSFLDCLCCGSTRQILRVDIRSVGCRGEDHEESARILSYHHELCRNLSEVVSEFAQRGVLIHSGE